MKALIIGNGGREEALAWKVSQSPLISDIFLAPGNGGSLHKCHNVEVDISNFSAVVSVIKAKDIQLVVVGPEVPLVDGLVDCLLADPALSDLYIVGPTKSGAALEGSKDFAKAFMKRHNIPTAKYRTFTSNTIEEGLRYLREEECPPYVLKADGLAAGKGVLILNTLEEAESAMRDMLEGKFGDASASVVVETYLEGIECSVFVLTDGKDYRILPTAKDYKRIGDGDKGLNTGGMGAVSPVPFVDDRFMDKVAQRIIEPTIQGLRDEGIDYRGFIFFGLMNRGGDPYVIEYNCRMGDPETEAVMMRIEGDFVPAMLSLRDQTLGETKPIKESSEIATTVVAVSGGYPEAYAKGKVISGVLEANEEPGTQIFDMGTKRTLAGELVTAGGRVLAVTALGKTAEEAIQKAYHRLGSIDFEGITYRRDIGQDLLKM